MYAFELEKNLRSRVVDASADAMDWLNCLLLASRDPWAWQLSIYQTAQRQAQRAMSELERLNWSRQWN